MKTRLGKRIVNARNALQEAALRPTWRTATVTITDPVTNTATARLDGSVEDITIPVPAGYLPAVGTGINLVMSGDEPVYAEVFDRTIQSNNFPGFGQGGPGWGIDIDGNAEFNEVTVRGLIQGTGGPELLPNGTWDHDSTGWTASAGTYTRQTGNPRSGAGHGRLVTASGVEQYLESGLIPIDPAFPHLAQAWFDKGAVGDISRVGIRWHDLAQAFLSESIGDSITGSTAYQRAYVYSEPPASVAGESVYYPSEDAVAVLVDGNVVTAPGSLYENIDEAAVDTSDFIAGTSSTPGAYLCRCTITAGAMSGKTISGLLVRYWVARGAVGSFWMIPALQIDGVDYYQGPIPITTVWPDAQTIDVLWTVNPATGEVWTDTEVEDFAAGGDSSFGAYLIATTAPANVAVLAKMELRPQWVSGSGAAYAKVRLYCDALAGGGSTFDVDDASLRRASVVEAAYVRAHGYRGIVADPYFELGDPSDRKPIRLHGSIEPLTVDDASLSDTSFNTAGTWVVWGGAALSILTLSAQRPIKVRATVRGAFFFSLFAGPFACAARVGISYDGGTTWDYGKQATGQQVTVPANDVRHVSATCVKSGTPTAAVLARAEVRKVAGASAALGAFIGQLDWEVVPATG